MEARQPGTSKHRAVGRDGEEPWFKKKRAKSRAKAKQVRRARRKNRK